MTIITFIIFSGFLVSISPLLMKPLDPKYVDTTVYGKARQLLLLKWIVLAFFVAKSYKQVLLVNLVDTGYEKPIENLEELVSSGKPLAAPINSNIPRLLSADPRTSAKKLVDQVRWYNFTGQLPEWAKQG